MSKNMEMWTRAKLNVHEKFMSTFVNTGLDRETASKNALDILYTDDGQKEVVTEYKRIRQLRGRK